MQLQYALIFCENAWAQNLLEGAVLTYFAATELSVIDQVKTDSLIPLPA